MLPGQLLWKMKWSQGLCSRGHLSVSYSLQCSSDKAWEKVCVVTEPLKHQQSAVQLQLQPPCSSIPAFTPSSALKKSTNPFTHYTSRGLEQKGMHVCTVLRSSFRMSMRVRSRQILFFILVTNTDTTAALVTTKLELHISDYLNVNEYAITILNCPF